MALIDKKTMEKNLAETQEIWPCRACGHGAYWHEAFADRQRCLACGDCPDYRAPERPASLHEALELSPLRGDARRSPRRDER